jgi:hypothetical protein
METDHNPNTDTPPGTHNSHGHSERNMSETNVEVKNPAKPDRIR